MKNANPHEALQGLAAALDELQAQIEARSLVLHEKWSNVLDEVRFIVEESKPQDDS